MPAYSRPVPFQADVASEAEAICRAELARDPAQPELHFLLGQLAARRRDDDLSVSCFSRAATLAPLNPKYHNALAEALGATGCSKEALSACLRALSLSAVDHDALQRLGRILDACDLRTEALAVYRQALRFDSAQPSTQLAIGRLLARQERWDQAIDAYAAALRTAPDDPATYESIGQVHLARHEWAAADYWFRQGIERDSDSLGLYLGLGTALTGLLSFPEALHAFRAAAAIAPLHVQACQHVVCTLELLRGDEGEGANAWHRLGVALGACGRLTDAADAYQQALRRKPDHLNALIQLGQAELALKQLADARQHLELAVAVRPNSRPAHVGLGFVAQAEGNLQFGWQEFRWYQGEDAECGRDFEQPLWDGEPLERQTLLLWADWALGDTLHFIRYASLVQRLVGCVVLECQPALVPLLRRLPGVARCVARATPLPSFSKHAPLFSLPRIFNTSLDTLPGRTPYVTLEASLALEWQTRLTSGGGLRLGFVWSGAHNQTNGLRRSDALSMFAPIGDLPHAHCVSLQQGSQAVDPFASSGRLHLEEYPESSRSITDAAALILNLDLLITVDTMVAHLAGAIGRPVWVLLPYAPDWRWNHGENTSPWYPTMRLFRQPRPGDWQSAIDQILLALQRVSEPNSLNT